MHNIVNVDLMAGTKDELSLKSVMIADKSGNTYTKKDLDNGMVCLLDGLVEGEREMYWGIVPAANSPLSKIVLIASPEELYDDRDRNLADFYNIAGVPARGYVLVKNGGFSVTVGCFINEANDAPVVGDIVELAASNKLKAVTTLTSGSTKVGKIAEIYSVSGITRYYVSIEE